MKIINQFSPARSGSTLLYNYLKNILKNYKIEKLHSIPPNSYNRIYFISIRHPYNSIISRLLVYIDKDKYIKNNIINFDKLNDILTFDLLNEGIKGYLENGGFSIISPNFDKLNKKIVLKYENFVKNHNIIIDKIISYFNLNISNNDINKIKNQLNITNVKKISNQLKEFKNWDKENYFHGKHISIFSGETDFNKILNKKNILFLKKNKNLNIILNKFNYK